jgi:DNA-binding CsgD family transcriptional regulator
MLLKVGFNNAEIAYALGISVDSVYKTRYRLRRKLEISEEYDLEKFTKTF